MATEKQYIFKIVLTGPESSGKTQMAQALASALKTVWAPEFARSYLGHLGRAYTRNDLPRIAQGQFAWETWYGIKAKRFLICDTDWTVLHIWEQVRYGVSDLNQGSFWSLGYPAAEPADLYLLCAPDFPWQPDPLREHPDARAALFQLYEQLLLSRDTRYAVLAGSHSVRMKTALTQIAKTFGTL